MQKKKREVLFRLESMEDFQEKVSPENKKLACKYFKAKLTHEMIF